MSIKNRKLSSLNSYELDQLIGATILVKKINTRYPVYKLLTDDSDNDTEIVQEKVAEVTVTINARKIAYSLKLVNVYTSGILIERDHVVLNPSKNKTLKQIGIVFAKKK